MYLFIIIIIENDTALVPTIVSACCILHNICEATDEDYDETDDNEQQQTTRLNAASSNVRAPASSGMVLAPSSASWVYDGRRGLMRACKKCTWQVDNKLAIIRFTLVLVRYLIPTIFIDTWIWFDTRYSILDTFVVNVISSTYSGDTWNDCAIKSP